MNFKFNIIRQQKKINRNSNFNHYSVHILGVISTPLSQNLLLSRNLTVIPEKALYYGKKKKCETWINFFIEKSISEQLDFLEYKYKSTKSSPSGPKNINNENKHRKKKVAIKNTNEVPQWRNEIRKLQGELAKTGKYKGAIEEEYKNIIKLKGEEGKNKSNSWKQKAQKLLEKKTKSTKPNGGKKGLYWRSVKLTPLGGQPGHKLGHHYK